MSAWQTSGFPQVPTPAGLLALAVGRLGGEMREACARLNSSTREVLGYRVVVWMPDPEAAMLLAALAEALGARLEMPEGTVVAFWLPIAFGVYPGGVRPPRPDLN